MLHRVVFVETVVAHGITGKFHVRQLLEPGAEVSALARSLSNYNDKEEHDDGVVQAGPWLRIMHTVLQVSRMPARI